MKKFFFSFVTFIEKLLLKNRWVLVKTPRYLGRKRTIDLSYKGWDFVRYSSLELCANEINQQVLNGAVAEVGVYQGDFAVKISEAFPQRNFYLYDTFEGFDDKDIAVERKNSFSSGNQDFSNTSVDKVLAKLSAKSNAIVRKGYFPETIKDEKSENFVFVSLDADLYKPIYDGLNFFYPRLVIGGYIFIHDFNNTEYLGAREAVSQFCRENQIHYFPLSDIAGTAVITR